MTRLHKLISRVTAMLMALQLISCIEPPLHLPGQELLAEMPAVETQLSVVWNVDADWSVDWYYGWDTIDTDIWGGIGYDMPTGFQVRRYYTGEEPLAPHTEVDAFSIRATTFRRYFSFGYYDLLLWSDIDSPDGTQVLVINERLESVDATTTGTRGLSKTVTSLSTPAKAPETGYYGLKNQPEIFYASYSEDIYISRDLNDYVYDPVENVYIKKIDAQLRPLVYIYLVQIILLNNDGRVKGINGNAAMSCLASGTNLNTGHTNNVPSMVYFGTRLKRDMVADGKPCEIIGGKFTTFGLCDMEPYTRAGAKYKGSRTELVNNLFFDLVFVNDTEQTYCFDVTDQCQNQAHGGVITVYIDCTKLDPPSGPEQGSGSLFVPTVEDYDEVYWEVEM